MDTPFMAAISEGLASRDLIVIRFEFPFMQRRRADGGRRPPDRMPALMEAWREAIATVGQAERLVIGGKSMGGRVASMIADDAGVSGLVCLGYPFHPPGKPERLRTEHLARIRTPTLILQGTRDPLGKPEEVTGYDLSEQVRFSWLEDGDHSFKPRVKSGRTLDRNLSEAVEVICGFIGDLG